MSHEQQDQRNFQVEKDLHLLSTARNYNSWLTDLVAPFCSGAILEIGSGIGNYSDFLVAAGNECMLTDSDQVYIDLLHDKYAAKPNVAIAPFRLGDQLPEQWRGRFDTMVIMNVLEHVENDYEALLNLVPGLAEKGRIVVIVPAHHWLMSDLDRQYGHYRRYSRTDFRKLSHKLGLHLQTNKYFNFIGILGWIKIKFFASLGLSRSSVYIFDNIVVPISKPIEKLLPPPAGLSLLAVFERPSSLMFND